MSLIYRVMLACVFVAFAHVAHAEKPYMPDETLERYIETHDVRADGSDRESLEVILRVDTPQGIEDDGVARISYQTSIDDLEDIAAWTIRPDGTELAVPAENIRTQAEGAEGGSSEFSDTQFKVIVFPAIEVGSRIHYLAHINHRTTPFPGYFATSMVFPPSWSGEQWELNINIPIALPLYVDQRGLKGGLASTEQGTNHYRYSYQWPKPVAPESSSVWSGDFADAIFASTFPDMVSIGRAYHAAAKPMATVTDPIRALAVEVTAGLTDDTSRVRALDHWVARNIRYVAVTLGHGGLIPHPADQVLAHRYGDCKDHAILLEALLTAVGIDSSAALVNLGAAYTQPTVGTIGPANHVITYIPGLDLYVDSTDQFSRVGTLSFEVMDKPTILASLGRLGHTPRMMSDRNAVHTVIRMKISADGSIEGESTASLSGVLEAESRAVRFSRQTSSEELVVRNLLGRFNETGKGSLDFPDPMALDTPFSVKATFQLDPVSNFPGPGAMFTPVGLAPGSIAGTATSKPIAKRQWPYTCLSRDLEDSYHIEFPAGVTIGPLPKGVMYRDATTAYQSSYTRQGNAINVHRELRVQRDSSVCNARDHDEWKRFHAILQRDLRTQIFYR